MSTTYSDVDGSDDPDEALAEMVRVVRRGGFLYSLIYFVVSGVRA